jgi:hypothetical protein
MRWDRELMEQSEVGAASTSRRLCGAVWATGFADGFGQRGQIVV